jgi:hypothetical protein
VEILDELGAKLCAAGRLRQQPEVAVSEPNEDYLVGGLEHVFFHIYILGRTIPTD